MYGKGKYIEINDNKAMTVSRNFLSAETQTLSRPEA